MSIFKCGLRFRAAVFGFYRNLYAARGFSSPLGLRFFPVFISGSRFLDAVFGFCSILSRPLRSRDFCSGLVSANILNNIWFLNDPYSDAFPRARTLFHLYWCYPIGQWMIGFWYFDRSWVYWSIVPCLLQFFQLFVDLTLLNAQLLRNFDSLGVFTSCRTIFRSLDH